MEHAARLARHRAIHSAAKNGDIQSVKELLARSASEYDAQSMLLAQESKSFYAACAHGNREIVQFFIEQGEAAGCLKPMLLSRFARALESAVEHGHEEIVQDILAAAEGQHCVSDMLLTKFAGATTVAATHASTPAGMRIFQALLQAGEAHGALPEMLMTGHAGMLSHAVEKNCTESVALLLDKARALNVLPDMLTTGSGHAYREALNHHHEALQQLLLEAARTAPANNSLNESTEETMLLGSYAYATQSAKHPERKEHVLELLRVALGQPDVSHDDVVARLEERMLRVFSRTRSMSDDAIRDLWEHPTAPALEMKPYQTAGLELECFGLSPEEELVFGPFIKQRFGWNSTLDKSIQNTPGTMQTEFVSPIITPENTMASQAAVSLIHRMGEVNDSCALHVHLGMKSNIPDDTKRLETMKQLAVNYLLMERAINRAVGDSPCVHHYEDVRDAAEKHLSKTVNHLLRAVSLGEVVDVLRPDSNAESFDFDNYTYTLQRRRSKLNIKEPMAEHGTTEFRHHPGSLEPNRVTAWGQYCLDMQDMALTMAAQGAHVPTPDELHALDTMVRDLRAAQRSASLTEQKKTPMDWARSTSAGYAVGMR